MRDHEPSGDGVWVENFSQTVVSVVLLQISDINP
jgi:hypothetical protein